MLTGQCPDCGYPIGGAGQPVPGQPYCSRCGLALTGELADELVRSAQELARLDEKRAQLSARFQHTLARLRQERAQRVAHASVPASGWPMPEDQRGWWPAAPGLWAPERAPQPGTTPAGPPPDASPPSVKTVLLVLGGVLLAVAAVVFTLVSWSSLGIGGRAAILGAITAVALATPAWLVRRLRDTAETIALLGVVLLLLDAYAIWAVDLAGVQHLDPAGYAAGALAVVCAGWVGYAVAVPLRLPLPTAVVLAQPVPMLAAIALDASPSGFVLAWGLTAALDLGVHHVARVRTTPGPTSGGVTRTATWIVATVTGILAETLSVAVGLVVLVVTTGRVELAWACGALAVPAATAFGYAALRPPDVGRHLAAAAGTVPLAAVGVRIAVELAQPGWYALAPAGVATLVTLAAVLARPSWRWGPLTTGTVLAAGVGVWAAALVTAAALGPLLWVNASWSGAPPHARAALSPLWEWPGSTAVLPATALVVVALAAAARVVFGGTAARATGLVGVAAAGLVLPVALDLPYPAALAALAALAVALLVVPVTLNESALHYTSAVLGFGVLVTTVGWSLAERPATLVLLGVFAVLLGCGVAVTRAVAVRAASVAGTVAFAGGEVAAVALAAGWPARYAAFPVLGTAAVALAAAALAHKRWPRQAVAPRAAAELGCCVLAAAAIAMTAPHGTLLALAVAGAGLLALAAALQPDRRAAVYAGVGLLLVATWVQLATMDVRVPEAYTAPPAALALLLGWLRRRQRPHISSWLAYAPGLVIILAPSVVTLWPDAGWLRAVLLGVGTVAVTLAGARTRLQAPLLLGSAAVAVVAGHELMPYVMELASLVPRWIPLALGGSVLLFAGATYERRLRDVRRLHGYISSLQ